MSHEIEATDSFGEVRSNGEKAWHGLGVELPEGLTAWEAFEQIGLGWETELLPLFATYQDAENKRRQFKVESHAVHVRSDTKASLGVVGATYKPISNRTLAEFADALVGADAAVTTETAGSLRGGRCIFSLVRLPKTIEVTSEDILKQYVLVRSSHDGSSAFQVYPTSIRVVCANTLRWSERDAIRGVRFQHTGDIGKKIDQARLVLGFISKETDRFEAMVRILAATHLKKDTVRQYFTSVYDATFGVVPEEGADKFAKQVEKRDAMLQRWSDNMDDARQSLKGISGTAWAAYNAISQWHEHERGRFGVVADSDGRAHSNMFGISDQQKRIAFDQAFALA